MTPWRDDDGPDDSPTHPAKDDNRSTHPTHPEHPPRRGKRHAGDSHGDSSSAESHQFSSSKEDSSEEDSSEEETMYLYGLFQLSDHVICANGSTPSLNLCQINCSGEFNKCDLSKQNMKNSTTRSLIE